MTILYLPFNLYNFIYFCPTPVDRAPVQWQHDTRHNCLFPVCYGNALKIEKYVICVGVIRYPIEIGNFLLFFNIWVPNFNK